ncbi:hypothetical protein OC842_005371 [Tilletia horrida]|uniref:Carotenoid oxygenase n=1 Tax=Tilletia horrida TaxID=155126 RepID=A0AAN6JIH4_9BASI|nr:hypothetical protein OC842_005371 [Tilletia horrida]
MAAPSTTTADTLVDPDGARLGYLTTPEHPEPVALEVKGRFPPWLSGTLWRNGPGTYELPTKDGKLCEISHWFDGHGLLHAFQLDGASNSVLYRSRSTTHDLDERIRSGDVNPLRFHRSPDPCKNIFSKMFSGFKNVAASAATSARLRGPSVSNVSVTVDPTFAAIGTLALPSQNGAQGTPLVTRTDANVLAALDPETLEPLRTLSYTSLNAELKGPLSAAHGVTIDGTYYNYVLDLGARPTYRVFGLGAGAAPGAEQAGGRVPPACTVLATLTDLPPAYLHSLAGTDKYLILSVWECDYGMNGLSILAANNLVGGLKPWTGRDTVHVVIDRLQGGVVARFSSPPMFVFHHINAFDRRRAGPHGEEEEEVVLDLGCWATNDVVAAFEIEALRAGEFERVYKKNRNYPARVVLPLPRSSSDPKANTLHHARVLTGNASDAAAQLSIELPVVNPTHAWKHSRFTYGIHHTGRSSGVLADSIVKFDMDALERRSAPAPAPVPASSNGKDEESPILVALWNDNRHTLVPSEPIFIPTPAEHGGTGAEDDGVLLTVALDSRARRSVLFAVDARSMETVAEADVARVVPYGFHGAFKSAGGAVGGAAGAAPPAML